MAQGVISTNKITVQSYSGTIGDKQVRMNLGSESKSNRIWASLLFKGAETPLEFHETLVGGKINGNFVVPPGYAPDPLAIKGTMKAYFYQDKAIQGTYQPIGEASPLTINLHKEFEL